MVTVVSSLAVTESMKVMNEENRLLLSGFITRSKLNTTSAAVTGFPSVKTAPSRNVTS